MPAHQGEYKSQLLALPEAEALQRLSAELRGAKQKMEQQQVQLEQLDSWTPWFLMVQGGWGWMKPWDANFFGGPGT